jgi:hypothetical protein
MTLARRLRLPSVRYQQLSVYLLEVASARWVTTQLTAVGNWSGLSSLYVLPMGMFLSRIREKVHQVQCRWSIEMKQIIFTIGLIFTIVFEYFYYWF